MARPPRVMTFAGAAAGGSAGIQADIKTFQEMDVYGMSVITAIVGRHPETKENVHPMTIEAIEAQFYTAMKQVGVDGLKTGMMFSVEIIETVSSLIEDLDGKAIVVDPVMVGKMKSKLLKDDAILALKERLIPKATIITPNVIEASILLDDRPIETVDDLAAAAMDLHSYGSPYVLVKGGRLEGPAIDVLYDGKTLTFYEAPRIDTDHTSGAGCSYSAAIAAQLTKGKRVEDAVLIAKSFVTTAIQHSFSYTNIVGPTYHAAERNFGKAHEIKITKREGRG